MSRMPVCITGMHRSGTSLVSNLLTLCGLYLGEDSDLMPATADNEAGYWENRRFIDLNDEILRELGGTWDFPPVVADGWAESEGLRSQRIKAEILVQEFSEHEPWGWKDPRNCLTLPFWNGLGSLSVPFWYGLAQKLKVVLCVRSPFEVSRSLDKREYTPNSAGLNLWLIYNRSVLSCTLPEDRIVTHYEAYFRNSRSELGKVLEFLEIPASNRVIEQASFAVSGRLRHQRCSAQSLRDEAVDSEALSLYQDLCREAEFADQLGV